MQTERSVNLWEHSKCKLNICHTRTNATRKDNSQVFGLIHSTAYVTLSDISLPVQSK